MMVDLASQWVAPDDVRDLVDSTLGDLRRNRIVERIWQKDHTVWKPAPAEITNRLGWLSVADEMRRNISDVTVFAEDIRSARFRDVVLLGMGGSSLCPEVFRATFGSRRGYPRLTVLDSTVPGWVRAVTESIDPVRTLIIVSSKSGGTIEVMSFFKHFWSKVERKKRGKAGENFIAITDPGTSLNALATQHGFRRVFLNPPDIGGRYSALSYFGLVPAALIGMDLHALLDPAIEMLRACHAEASANPAALLGAAMGALAKTGRDKLTIVASPSIASFGLWAEQLIAESTGKDGRGIVPIALEPLVRPERYSPDRLFVVLHVVEGDDRGLPRIVDALHSAGHPVLTFRLADRYALGAEMFRWEMATAIAGHVLGIHPFDQPNVQESKDNTRRVLDRYQSHGKLPNAESSGSLAGLLSQARPGDFVALMGYLTESRAIVRAIHDLRAAILERFQLPNTFGYGPRFLHSTGQLHKGGANSGLFVQLVTNGARDVPIPGELFSFGALAAAQALGDFISLQSHGRRVIRIDLGSNPVTALRELTRSIGGKVISSRKPAARKKTARNPNAAVKRNKRR